MRIWSFRFCKFGKPCGELLPWALLPRINVWKEINEVMEFHNLHIWAPMTPICSPFTCGELLLWAPLPCIIVCKEIHGLLSFIFFILFLIVIWKFVKPCGELLLWASLPCINMWKKIYEVMELVDFLAKDIFCQTLGSWISAIIHTLASQPKVWQKISLARKSTT